MKRIEVNLYEGDKLIGKKEFTYESLPYITWDTNLQKIIKDIEIEKLNLRKSTWYERLFKIDRYIRKEKDN